MTFARSTLLLALFVAIIPLAYAHEDGEPHEEFMRARVTGILEEQTDTDYDGQERTVQRVQLEVISGHEEGTEFQTENIVLGDRADMRVNVGDVFVVRQLHKVDGSMEYLVAERYRLPSVLWLLMFFIVLAFLFGGLTGLRSLFGLLVSILVLAVFVVPQIAGGKNPMLISLIGSFAIACTSLYLAHGFNRRTSVALLSTVSTLGIATLLSFFFVRVAKLFGTGSEEAIFLQSGPAASQINLQGLLLGGMIIGCLGVLDDITTAQTAAVDEIRKANPALSKRELLQAGFSVGKEHIASLINTLALAYAGASLPLLLLFQADHNSPLWATLNSEFLAEEIIRTLVGSSTLLFAVPISTWCAVHLLLNGGSGRLHVHAHS